MTRLKTLVKHREFSVFAMLLLVALYLSFSNDYFLSQRNLMNVGRQGSVVAIVALGQALVIIARGIDLSVGSVIGLSAVCAAITLQTTGSDILALAAGLGAGLSAGCLNGLMVTRFRINPFIATLGMHSRRQSGKRRPQSGHGLRARRHRRRGAMLRALLNNAFVLLGISAYWQVVTKGLIRRIQRPVCYRNLPESVPPAGLK
ncbi:ABC transporter permease [Martelella soudanensis]|nr:hypothetical protein [Martelella sp. NC18]